MREKRWTSTLESERAWKGVFYKHKMLEAQIQQQNDDNNNNKCYAGWREIENLIQRAVCGAHESRYRYLSTCGLIDLIPQPKYGKWSYLVNIVMV